ncbi:MAG: ABC transporter ATP-binding protein, partial [Anaerolineales bacterium]|nr:ABC transporter ATP-binding protein [Anaerolineales bacterium]
MSKAKKITKQLADRSTVRMVWRAYGYLRPYRIQVIGVYVLMLLIVTISMVVPQFIRWIVDTGIGQKDMRLLGWAVAALLGLTLVKGVLIFLQGKWTEVASQNVAYDLRNEMQTRLTELSFAYHDQTEAGQLLSRALQDVERIRFLTGRAVLRLIEGFFYLIVTAVVLIWMNSQLALLVALTIPLLVYRAYDFGRQYRPLSVQIQNQLGVMTTRLEQNLRGTRVVKSFAQETAEIGRFDMENEKWFGLSANAARLESLNMPQLQFISDLGLVLILLVGGRLVINGGLTLGELVAFTTYLGQLVRPIRLIGMVIPAVAMAGAAAERVFAIIDAVPEVQDAPHAKPFGPVRGEVQFEQVSFAYEGRRRVLHEVDFTAVSGSIVALLGATGSGKSTITNLVQRFYDPTGGRVLVDGQDIRDGTVFSLRSQIGVVMQETMLFASTIRENIAFGRPEAADVEIEAAAQAAQAHDFIMGMPDGYQTLVGERGMTLSGGQKQRIAIARALLTDPRILILDDATASVDTETERLIQLALDRLMQNRTTFVIAHRLSTVRRADLILLLEKGHIVARGTHADLLQTSPLYAQI